MSVRFTWTKRHLIVGLAAFSGLGAVSSIGHYYYSSTGEARFAEAHSTSLIYSPAKEPVKANISAAANALFSQDGKQDRADFAARQIAAPPIERDTTGAVNNPDRVQFVSASLTPVGMNRPGPTRIAGYFRQDVNRDGKSDRLAAAQIAVAKPAIVAAAEEEEESAAGVSAALFFVAPPANAAQNHDQFRPDDNPGPTLAAASAAPEAKVEASPKASWADLIKLARVGGGDGESKKPSIFGALTEDEFRAREFSCMATAIYFESRGESVKGQTAVAQVIMTRVRSDFYPNTICGVVYQGQWNRNACQFSFACDGRADTPKNRKQWETALDVARKVISGQVYLKEVGDATHYHATYVSPQWKKMVKRVAKVGVHIFYKAPFVQPLVASADFKAL